MSAEDNALLMIDVLILHDLVAQQAQPQGDSFSMLVVPILAMLGFYYFIIIRPESAARKKRAQLLAGMKKNDQVVTIHGIYGSIANISPDSDEVTVKVDDNTRLRMRKSAIETVIVPKEASTSKTA